MKSLSKIILLAIIFGAISGALVSLVVLNLQPGKEDLMRDFYLTENYIHVSPHGLRKHMDKGDDDFILVDLRSQEEYEKEHIIGAVNIPAYRDPDTSAYGDVERIVSMFKSLQERNPDKDLIVYCYSIPCMTGRKIGKMLAEHGIYVKQLGIGWNEWRYYWELWNHEHEWDQTDVEDYIISGPEPGTPKLKIDSEICDIEGEFGC
jgi:rhodanese-related sulfurtransferase